MSIPASRAVQAYGQSIWYDMIDRELLTSGKLDRLIAEQGLAGLTSNPSIFEKAIAQSSQYDSALREARRRQPHARAQDLFLDLAIDDIRAAADHFAALHQASQGEHGWVSLEVAPDLAYDTEATIAEARNLFDRVARPNVMIKVPATLESLQAIETLIDLGINLNVTLLFSVERYKQVADAYLLGLEARLRRGQPLSGLRSVASLFVSRLDTLVDKHLQSIISQGESEQTELARSLLGKTAIANAKLAYQQYKLIFQSPRFEALAAQGAHVQRLLWASTSTKNPAYNPLLYAESLIGEDTINTLPPATFMTFNEQGQVADTLETGIDEAAAVLASLEDLDINLAASTHELETDGVAAFARSHQNLLQAIDDKTARLSGTNG